MSVEASPSSQPPNRTIPSHLPTPTDICTTRNLSRAFGIEHFIWLSVIWQNNIKHRFLLSPNYWFMLRPYMVDTMLYLYLHNEYRIGHIGFQDFYACACYKYLRYWEGIADAQIPDSIRDFSLKNEINIYNFAVIYVSYQWILQGVSLPLSYVAHLAVSHSVRRNRKS